MFLSTGWTITHSSCSVTVILKPEPWNHFRNVNLLKLLSVKKIQLLLQPAYFCRLLLSVALHVPVRLQFFLWREPAHFSKGLRADGYVQLFAELGFSFFNEICWLQVLISCSRATISSGFSISTASVKKSCMSFSLTACWCKCVWSCLLTGFFLLFPGVCVQWRFLFFQPCSHVEF